MYNIGTDKKISRGQNYQIGLRLNWFWGNPNYPIIGTYPHMHDKILYNICVITVVFIKMNW